MENEEQDYKNAMRAFYNKYIKMRKMAIRYQRMAIAFSVLRQRNLPLEQHLAKAADRNAG